MKNHFGHFILILLTTIFFSCTPTQNIVVTSHQDVMNVYKTKDQVISRFGIPTSKRSDIGLDEWYYDYGTKTVTDKKASLKGVLGGNKNSVGTIYTGTSGNASATGSSKIVSQELKIYVKFTFKADSVITWDTNGLDYGYATAVQQVKKEVPKKESKKKSKKKK